MKKYIIYLIILLIILSTALALWLPNNKSNLTKVRVAEVAHTIFYAPQYVAHALGYFEDEGLDVELILIPGADRVTAAVLSNDVHIGFCGSEATIYVYNGGEQDYLVNFAGLTKRDGTFIVSRKKYENFKLEDLKGKTLIGGRKGGMPQMTLEWALRQNGIDPNRDLYIDTSIAFAAMQGSFIGGHGDFVTLFEPNALQLERQELGFVVAAVGELGGIVPYTSYSARKSFIENNPDIIRGFTNAIQRGLDFVHNNSSEKVAEIILSYFPDTSLNDIVEIVERYRIADSWFTTTYITEDDFNHIQTIMISAGELKEKVPYEKLVTTKYARNR